MKLFNDKKTRYRNLLLVLIPFLLLGGFFGFTAYRSYKSMFNGGDTEIEKSPKYSLPDYGYQLRANATTVQFDYFQELIDVISAEEKDEVKIAESIAKCFVSDFYTWSNKSGMYDIGGMCYVFYPYLGNIYTDARDNYYYYLNYYIDEYGQENLPEVESVEILGSEKTSNMTVDGVTYPCWYVRVQWKYVEKAGGFDLSVLDTKEDIYIIRNEDSGRYEISQMFEVVE